MEITELLQELKIALVEKSQAMEIATLNFKEFPNRRRENIDTLAQEMEAMNAAFMEMRTISEELKPVAEFIVENLSFAKKIINKTKVYAPKG